MKELDDTNHYPPHQDLALDPCLIYDTCFRQTKEWRQRNQPNQDPPTPNRARNTVYPKKYAHGFCFAVLCCGYTLTDFPISIRLTSPALWQSNDCPSASRATLMNMDKYFMWIHYERLHNHNKAKHHKTVCIFLGMYCMLGADMTGCLTRSTHIFALFTNVIFFKSYVSWHHCMR